MSQEIIKIEDIDLDNIIKLGAVSSESTFRKISNGKELRALYEKEAAILEEKGLLYGIVMLGQVISGSNVIYMHCIPSRDHNPEKLIDSHLTLEGLFDSNKFGEIQTELKNHSNEIKNFYGKKIRPAQLKKGIWGQMTSYTGKTKFLQEILKKYF